MVIQPFDENQVEEFAVVKEMFVPLIVKEKHCGI